MYDEEDLVVGNLVEVVDESAAQRIGPRARIHAFRDGHVDMRWNEDPMRAHGANHWLVKGRFVRYVPEPRSGQAKPYETPCPACGFTGGLTHRCTGQAKPYETPCPACGFTGGLTHRCTGQAPIPMRPNPDGTVDHHDDVNWARKFVASLEEAIDDASTGLEWPVLPTPSCS